MVDCFIFWLWTFGAAISCNTNQVAILQLENLSSLSFLLSAYYIYGRISISLEEEYLMPDHVHMLISIPPKYAVSNVVWYIKGKKCITFGPDIWRAKRNFVGQQFWALGWFRLIGRTWWADDPWVRSSPRTWIPAIGAVEAGVSEQLHCRLPIMFLTKAALNDSQTKAPSYA